MSSATPVRVPYLFSFMVLISTKEMGTSQHIQHFLLWDTLTYPKGNSYVELDVADHRHHISLTVI